MQPTKRERCRSRRSSWWGLVSNICVVANAVLVKTACPDVPVTVDAACTGSFDVRLNEAALDTMESLQIKVANR